MPISLEEVQQLKDELEDEYQERHDAHRELRDFWQGTGWWKNADSGSGSIASIFKDLTAKRSDVGPDIKLVHNLLQEVCVKYQTFLSPLPMIRTYVDPPESLQRRQQATLKERVLYGLWSEGNMAQVANRAAWYLPLMGDCFLGVWPDFERKIVRPLLRSPEYAFPVMNFDNTEVDAYIFCWDAPLSKVKRAFPKYVHVPEKRRGFFPFAQRRPTEEPTVQIMEYFDKNEFSRWVGTQKTHGIKHDFGFNLFEQMSFIHVPDEPWNHGAVEQAVNRIEMGNALYSLMFQAVLENVFPTLFLINPMKAPETLDLGAGGVVGINEGGDAKWMAPPIQTIAAQMQFLQENERSIKQSTAMPDVNFGQFDASIVTGKAINELQGAGTGSTVEMVQGIGIGSGFVKWNEKALFMLKNMFRDDQIYLYGTVPGSMMDINPRQFGLKFKGSQIVGSERNEVVFSPHLGLHEKLVMGLQAAGGGLVSKKYQREQIGIPDSEAMDEEILGEVVNEAVIGSILQSLQADASPEHAQEVESKGLAYLSGETSPHPALSLTSGSPSPGPAAPVGPGGGSPPAGPAGPAAGGGGPPVGPLGPGAPGQAISQALPLPQGSPPPDAMQPPSAPQGQSNTVQVQDVVLAMQSVSGLSGRVFLVGEIVQRGSTDSDIEIAVTDAADKQPIADALKQWAGRISFHVVEAEPTEPHLEVTPGAQAQPGAPA